MSDRKFARKNISSRLCLAREMAGLTQRQVARSMGWHRPTVSEIEAGRRKVNAEEIALLAEIYGVNILWIMGQDEGPVSESGRVTLASRELSKLKDEDLDRLLQLIRALRFSKEEEANGTEHNR